MLTDLHVKNLALIDEAEVSFGPGLNILTGETGAGKSILIGSINLALGQKISMDMIRKGADSALVELIFQVEHPEVEAKIRKLGIEPEDGQIVIARKVQNGRSINRINGETCRLSRLREISSLLLDIHGQHEHQSLLYPEHQLEILDAFGHESIDPLKEEAASCYLAWRDLNRQLSHFQMDGDKREREISFLQYEIREIDEAKLRDGEEEELEAAYRKMSASQKIAETFGEVMRMTGDDEGAGDQVSRAVREIGSISSYDEAIREMENTLSDVEELLSEFNRSVSGYLSDFSFSDAEFYETESRLDTIRTLHSRYGRTYQDVMDYREKQAERLEELEHFEERKAELEKQESAAEKRLREACEKLSGARKKAAEQLSEQIRESLKDLNFLSVDFAIVFTEEKTYRRDGFDQIEFRISTNPGEKLKPLSAVVSGGELSRIMLAIKTILADRDQTETLIFDEIDTGISGRTAQKVSEKLARISRSHQVICITHLAQIASMADHHFAIEKNVEDGAAISRIRELDEEESCEELARILGGAEITDTVRENAKEMKQLAREISQKIR